MASQVSFCQATAARRRFSINQAAWFTTALTSLSAAAGAWWDHSQAEPSGYRSAAGVVLLAMAGWQWVLARRSAGGRYSHGRRPWKAAPRGPAGKRPAPTRSASWKPTLQTDAGWKPTLQSDAGWKPTLQSDAGWKPTLQGVMCSLAVSYGICLWVGNEPGVGWMFLACLSCCFTAVLIRSARRRAGKPTTRWGAPRRSMELVGNCACWLAAGLILCEAGLRLAESLSGQGWPASEEGGAWRVEGGGQRKGSRGERGIQRPGQFRVAVLGDAQTLTNNEGMSFLAHIEVRLPGVEVCTFVRENRGEHAAVVAEQVARFQPDVVLTFLSLGDDLLGRFSRGGPFDWRGLRLARLAALLSAGSSGPSEQGDSRTDDYETFLRSISGQLTICRTPIAGDDERRWQEALGNLSDLVEQCRRRDLPVALVLVPSQVQVNPLICEALRRRVGYESSQVDLELPQRRLARFADEHQLPVLDLLPHFRASREEVFRRQQGALSQWGHDLTGELIGGWLRQRYAGAGGRQGDKATRGQGERKRRGVGWSLASADS